MISRIVFKDVVRRVNNFTPVLSLTSGIVTLIIISFASFSITSYFSSLEGIFSLGTSAFVSGHVLKLLTYSFHHKTMAQLLLNIGVLLPLCSTIEKSVGTVRFLFLFLLLSAITGTLYTILQMVFVDSSLQIQVEGFVPVSLALLSVTTMHSRMTKAYLFGVNVPTLALPWLFLMIISLLVPHTVLICNVVAIGTGWIYGKGWFSLLDMSEVRASILDKKMPFRLLRNIGVVYVPAAMEEKRKVLHPRITPTPGSYPVQAYAPVSSPSSLQAIEAKPNLYEGWSNTSYTTASPIPHSAQHGHSYAYGLAQSFGLNHGHSHSPIHGHSHSHEPSHGHSCNHSHNQGHGHSHEHGFGDGNSDSGQESPNRWTHNESHSQHSHVSPMNMYSGHPAGNVFRPTMFSGPPEGELAPTSVLVDPGKTAGFSP